MADVECEYAVVLRPIWNFGRRRIMCSAQDRKRFTYLGSKYYPCESDNFRECEIYLGKQKLKREIEVERELILEEIGFGD